MTMIKAIKAPLTPSTAKSLVAGDHVRISGTIYTARDAAHQRMVDELEKKGTLPFEITNEIIFYMGPCPAKPGKIIGPAGPTTSHRMDAYTPRLLEEGLLGMIGKGNRSKEVMASIVQKGAVYFGCVGGTGALCAQAVKSVEIIAYEDLGTEAIRRLVVEDFPAIVVIDSQGQNLYEIEQLKYRNYSFK
ncbi:MAG: Fe-S-containing hydro-lyase [Eubacterium sp.]